MAKKCCECKCDKTSHDYILIDRSGSMGIRMQEALTAVNYYVEEMKARDKNKGKVTIVAFDDYRGLDYTVLRDSADVEYCLPLNHEECVARGGTPLYDAMAKMIAQIESDNADEVVFVVLTGGAENASNEYTKEKIAVALERLKEKNYQVVFLGADFNAMSESGKINIAASATLNMKGGNYVEGFKGLYATRSMYKDQGAMMSFSDQVRAQAAGDDTDVA